MSKIGKINITIPDKVKVALTGNNFNVEGPFGKKTVPFDIENFNLEILNGKEVTIKPKKLDQNYSLLHPYQIIGYLALQHEIMDFRVKYLLSYLVAAACKIILYFLKTILYFQK